LAIDIFEKRGVGVGGRNWQRGGMGL